MASWQPTVALGGQLAAGGVLRMTFWSQ